jgi:hypothetical protein
MGYQFSQAKKSNIKLSGSVVASSSWHDSSLEDYDGIFLYFILMCQIRDAVGRKAGKRLGFPHCWNPK